MKTIFQSKAILCSIVILLITALDSKGQWEYKHAAPTGNNLRKIKFATSNIGWIIGETGTILKTTDGGNTWLNQYYFGNDDIIDLSVVDSNNLYLVTATNELYLSSDGGNKWYLKSFFWSGGCSAISFININEGWASIGNNIQHTTDGGINWSSQFNFPNEYISAIKMESNGNGIAVSTFGTLFHSSDYGQNWSVDANHTGNFNAMDVNTFYSTALAINNNTLYKSTDNGATWNDPVTTPAEFSLSTPTSIKIIYATVYLATTVDGQVLFTSDGGTTWNSNSDLLGNSLSDCIGLSPTKIIAVGNQGKIGWSNNAGSTLTSLETRITNQELWGVHHNGNNLVAVGDGGSILLSNNSGQTWSLSNSGSTENLKSVVVINPNTAVAVGSNGTILKTTNTGGSWTLVGSGYSDNINFIHRLPNGTLYAVGDNDLILMSTDDGNTWNFTTTSFTGFQYNFRDIYFTSNDTGFIATNSAEIITTDDGGQNWYLRMTGLFGQMTCLSFADGLNGWIGSTSGEIFYTDNGGQSWNDRSMVGFSGSINRLKFIDVNTGWAFTDQGIFKTIDGGITWIKEFSPCNSIHSIDFISNYAAIALGAGEGKIIGRNSDVILSVNAGTYCSGHEYTFGAFSLGNFNADNQFIAQLSDDFGNFDYPTEIATVTANTINSITVTLPSSIPPSAFYRLRIASTNPTMYSSPSSNYLDIHDSPQGLIYANANTTFNNGDSVLLINITGVIGNYQWYNNGIAIPGATDDSLTVKTPGHYYLTINDGTCDGNSNEIEVIVNGFSGISSNNTLQLKYFPNPASENLTVILGENNFNQYQIVDLSGKIVLSDTGNFNKELKIPVKSLTSGFYLLQLKGEQQTTLKFSKD